LSGNKSIGGDIEGEGGEVIPSSKDIGRAKPKLGKNEPAAEIKGGGVQENVFGEKTIHPSLKSWVESHGFDVRPVGDAFEVGVPWSNRAKGTSGVSWIKFRNLEEAKEALGY
jgi:hypothetical protein